MILFSAIIEANDSSVVSLDWQPHHMSSWDGVQGNPYSLQGYT